MSPMVLAVCKGEDGSAEFWEGEREIIELTQRLKLGQYRLGLFESGKVEELERLKGVLTANEARLKALEADKSALTDEITRLAARNTESFRIAREAQRARSKGAKFETLATRDGRTFKNATVSAVDESGVAIRHEHGAATLRYAELSDEQRRFFGLEESAALAAEDRERREALAYEQSIAEELEAMREQEESLAAIGETFNSSRASSSSLAALSRPQTETRALAQPAKPFGSGSVYRRWYGYSGYRSYRPVYRYVYRYPTARVPSCPSSGSAGAPFQNRAPCASPYTTP